MIPRQIRSQFLERRNEVEQYLALLHMIENAAGPFGNQALPNVQSDHLNILRAHMYLHLYNLVEATMTWCLIAVGEAPKRRKSWRPQHLIPEMLSELVQYSMQDAVNPDKVKRRAIELTQRIIDKESMQTFDFAIGKNAGNWNQSRIYDAARRLGVRLSIDPAVQQRIYQSQYVDRIWDRRNKLAHGDLSFEQAGEDTSLGDLEEITKWTLDYMAEVLDSFCRYVTDHEFLRDQHRPKGSINATNSSD